jgi:hypothetical protein
LGLTTVIVGGNRGNSSRNLKFDTSEIRKQEDQAKSLMAKSSGTENPNGVAASSPRLRGTSYLGEWSDGITTPTGLRKVSAFHTGWRLFVQNLSSRVINAQPLWGCKSPSTIFPRVARCSQPWASRSEPLWGSQASQSRRRGGQFVRIRAIRVCLFSQGSFSSTSAGPMKDGSRPWASRSEPLWGSQAVNSCNSCLSCKQKSRPFPGGL